MNGRAKQTTPAYILYTSFVTIVIRRRDVKSQLTNTDFTLIQRLVLCMSCVLFCFFFRFVFKVTVSKIQFSFYIVQFQQTTFLHSSFKSRKTVSIVEFFFLRLALHHHHQHHYHHRYTVQTNDYSNQPECCGMVTLQIQPNEISTENCCILSLSRWNERE